MNKQDGYALDVETGYWVHAKCRKMTKMVFMKKVKSMSDAELKELMENALKNS